MESVESRHRTDFTALNLGDLDAAVALVAEDGSFRLVPGLRRQHAGDLLRRRRSTRDGA